jgi:NAD(P)-dependent dehydrogenase (short-subunit alcohol dehydrogenase family)
MSNAAPDFRLQGSRVLVTGASLGIGRAVAQALAGLGAEVVLAARGRAGLDTLAHEITAAGGRAVVLPFDASDPGAIGAAIDAAGPLDGLVNNAGSVTREPFLEASEAEIDRILALNVKGAALVAQAVARGMVARAARGTGTSGQRGSIVNIASIAGLVGARNRSVYAASKHAVMGLTRAMALELGPHGIRVNAVCPGLVNTPLAADLMADAGFVAATRARIPLGRIMEPEDIAGPVAFLLSAAAAGITGIALPVDGGVTAE